jgi:hypothetical protein
MRKFVLTKELFDSDDLRDQNEIPYLSGELKKSFRPLGEEKMNLNTLIIMCPFFILCLGDSATEGHYSHYEDGIYLFVFINKKFRCHIAFDLKIKDSINMAFILYKLPINFDNPKESIEVSYITEDVTMDEVSNFLNKQGFDLFIKYGFQNIVYFNHKVVTTKMN